MTTTGQDPGKGADASSASAQTPEPSKEARQVPLDALVEARKKAQELQERVAKLESDLAQSKNTQQPAAAAQPPSDIDQVKKTLQEMQHKEHVRNLTVELGLADEKQAAAVAEIQQKHGIDAAEALELAVKRKPDLFKDRGQPGFDPRIHGSMRPRAGTPPEPKTSDRVKRLEAMKKATGEDKQRLTNNYVGGLAAEAIGMGKHHKKIPI